MEIPVKKLSKLLSEDTPTEVRASALIVLAELGIKDAEITANILHCLEAEDSDLRIRAIQAVGRLKITKALPRLLEMIPAGGNESRLAADVAATLGDSAVKQLQSLMGQVAPGIRRFIAAALTGAGGAGAEAGVTVLLDSDPQVAASAATAIISRIPGMPPGKKAELLHELISMASDRKKKLPPSSELPVLRVLASLNDPAAADLFWERTRPPYSHEVRALALQAAGGWLKNPSKDQWKRLFQNAHESDFSILAPTLAILQRMPGAEKHTDEWLELLTAPDAAPRRLALEKLGSLDTKEYAAALMMQIHHSDRGLRDAARQRLSQMEHGRKALVSALLAEENSEELWQLARMMMPFARSVPKPLQDQILAKAAVYVEKDDHRSDPLFALMREANPEGLKEHLFEKAIARRKKTDYETALKYLKILARDPAVGFAIRLELAMNGLKLSPKEIAQDIRNNDPCLRNFHSAISQNYDDVVKLVEKAKWLDAEDLFYLGFHFAEQFHQEKSFGVHILKHLIQSSPKSKLAASARNKLKSVGVK